MSELLIVPTTPEKDYSQLARIIESTTGESLTAERLYHRDTEFVEGDVFEQYTAIINDKIVGYSSLSKANTVIIPKMAVTVMVDPDFQGNGYGSQIYDHILHRAQHYGAEILVSSCLEDSVRSLQFAQKRGFSIKHHLFESVLDTVEFDMAQHGTLVKAVEQSGIRFSSLVAEGNNDANLRKLYSLNTRLAQDEPTNDGSWEHNYRTWKARIAGADWFYPPGQLLAIDGDQYIGLGAIGFEPDGQAFNAYTGVLPAYRGRKIAQALKIKGVEFARACGAKTLQTTNDSQNVGMLAINNKFGYQRLPGSYHLVKNL